MKGDTPVNIALLTAAGTGTRMLSEVPKQFLNVFDKPIIVYTMEAFQRHPMIDAIVVVCLSGWEPVLSAYARQFGISKLECVVPGGDTGQASIRGGLNAIRERHSLEDVVLIHDGNRPMLAEAVITGCIETARAHGSAVAVVPCNEAMLVSGNATVSGQSIPRETLFKTQTPHGFPLGALLDLHTRAKEKGITGSVASCTLMIELGGEVHFCPGSEKNFKITTPEDIEIFKALLMAEKERL